MVDFLAAASIRAAMRQDFPDHLEYRLVRERGRRHLALHEAFSLVMTRWQRPPRPAHRMDPSLTPPL